MTKTAHVFAERCELINRELTGADRMSMLMNLKADIDVECVDVKYKPDGSTIYKFHDRSFLKVHGSSMTVSSSKEFGVQHRKSGRLSLEWDDNHGRIEAWPTRRSA